MNDTSNDWRVPAARWHEAHAFALREQAKKSMRSRVVDSSLSGAIWHENCAKLIRDGDTPQGVPEAALDGIRDLSLVRRDGQWSLYAFNAEGEIVQIANGTAEWDAEREAWSAPTPDDYAAAIVGGPKPSAPALPSGPPPTSPAPRAP